MGNSEHREYIRPRFLSLLPLQSPIRAEPSRSALERIPPGVVERPFDDISSDVRLAQWSRSSHVFPAAYPRSIVGSSVPEAVPPSFPSSYDALAIADEIHTGNLRARKRLEDSVVEEPQLFVSVARYFLDSESDARNSMHHHPTSRFEPITLILAHANGFHKETWEPALAHLILSPAGRRIQEIWSIDCVNHGDSAILNRQHLGLPFDWADYARDLMNFILSYLPDQTSSRSRLPVILPRLECPDPSLFHLDRSTRPIKSQATLWRGRALGLMGHSLGACAAALAATSIPELFHEVIIIDPSIRSETGKDSAPKMHLGALAAKRTDEWDNQAAALEKFRQNKSFFGLWDPAVLSRFVRYALERCQPTKLKCLKLHETSVFISGHNRSRQAYLRLRDILHTFLEGTPHPPDYPPFRFFLILGNEKLSVVSEEAFLCHPNMYKSDLVVRIISCGHLIAQEAPRELAFAVSLHLMNPNAHHPCHPSPSHVLLPSKL